MPNHKQIWSLLSAKTGDDAPSAFAPDSISDLVSWYKSDTNVTITTIADEQRVTDWADVDGNFPLEQDFTNISPRLIDATHGFAPDGIVGDLQNGYPYLHMPGNYYVTGLTPVLTDPFTMVFVTRYFGSNGGAYAYRFSVGGNSGVDGIPGAGEAIRSHYGYKEVVGYDYTTSATTLTIGTGAHTVVVADDLGWHSAPPPTMYMTLQADNDNCMNGTVTSFDPSTKTMVVNITTIDGSGTFSSWDVRGLYSNYSYTNYPNVTKWDTLINVYDGASSKSIVNGVDNGSGTMPTPMKHTGLKFTYSEYLEVITYNKALDTDEIAELGTYLTDKYAETSFVDRWSMYFDGVDEYVQVATTSDVLMDFRSAWSVSWWAKWTFSAAFDCFWQFGRTTGTAGQLAYVIGWLHSTGVGWSHSASPSSTVNYNLGGTLNDGNWHHFVLTGTGASTNGTLYIDGSLNTDTPTTTGATAATATMNNIGRGYATTGRFFDGNMDDVAIWDTALDADTITSIYNSGAPNDLTLAASYTAGSGVDKSGDLQGYWLMGDGATYNGGLALPYTIPDESANSNNGSFTNGSMVNAKMDTP